MAKENLFLVESTEEICIKLVLRVMGRERISELILKLLQICLIKVVHLCDRGSQDVSAVAVAIPPLQRLQLGCKVVAEAKVGENLAGAKAQVVGLRM